MDQSLQQEILTALYEKTIGDLKLLPQPIARVCGPLTTGGFGYEKNAERLTRAEAVLIEKGYTVFRFGDAEESIQGKGYDHAAIMDIFHTPILKSGLIKEAFFLPKWQESKGAMIERELCQENGIAIKEFPEEWF